MDGKKVDCGAEFEDGSFIWASTADETLTVNIGVLYVEAQPVAYGFQRQNGISQVGFTFLLMRNSREPLKLRHYI